MSDASHTGPPLRRDAVHRRVADREQLIEALVGPLVGGMVRRASEQGALAEDVGPGDFALLQLVVGTVRERAREVDPQRWQRMPESLPAGRRDSVPSVRDR